MKFLLSILACFIMTTSTQAEDLFTQVRASTVKITNEAETSGGSGTIIKSTTSASVILTNAHVCALLERGGKVITTKGTRHQARKYKTSKQHDLCLVVVAEDLEVRTYLADSAPKSGEEIAVSGHPYLFPQLFVPGHLTDKMDVTMVGAVEKCSKKEFEQTPLMCAFFGMPIIKKYETRVVSSMIAPGNSGSGVYNTKGELVGVVFAGSGRGYSSGIIVPYEYVRGFLKVEYYKLKWKSAKTSFKYSEYEERAFISNSSNTNDIRLSDLKEKDNVVFPAIFSPQLDKLFITLQCALGKSNQCLGK